MSGSLRLGIAAYAQIPHAITPTSRTHDTCLFSTKNRATLSRGGGASKSVSVIGDTYWISFTTSPD
jgi:hypothetical protein